MLAGKSPSGSHKAYTRVRLMRHSPDGISCGVITVYRESDFLRDGVMGWERGGAGAEVLPLQEKVNSRTLVPVPVGVYIGRS